MLVVDPCENDCPSLTTNYFNKLWKKFVTVAKLIYEKEYNFYNRQELVVSYIVYKVINFFFLVRRVINFDTYVTSIGI